MVRFSELPPEFWREFRLWRSVGNELNGLSPPGNFVGSMNYPHINVGALINDGNIDASILDNPEEWFRHGFAQWDIVKLRSRIVLSRIKVSVRSFNNSIVDKIQELSIGRNPVDVEVRLRRLVLRALADDYHAPLGNVGELRDLRITSNVSAERIVERLVNDYDADARAAVVELYRGSIPVSRIQRIFAVGLLGDRRFRRLVPTRWSITAVDSIIGDYLRDKVIEYDEVGQVEVHEMEYMENRYFVMLMPGPWRYELIELKMPGSVWNRGGSSPRVFADYERTKGMKGYAESTGGAFYAIRLGVLEYLNKVSRQASAIAIREVTPEYRVPVGIWQAREAVRNGMGVNARRFSDVNEAINYVNASLLTGSLWLNYSRLIREFRSDLVKFLI
ncbi:Nre family DNA repair protein [Vulcanisaeta sp. JCM 16159]|uniref:Nre family DNA repair protein n=1 Tax=Vulcanisaeta sp. JCM 16159 TaxID=1295371 RepID=UPI0006D11713|nr:Nre family DNA repair protein [Vulcanisaeta sp. JCM 16159]